MKDLAMLLTMRRISGVPVVDEGGAVVGIVSEPGGGAVNLAARG